MSKQEDDSILFNGIADMEPEAFALDKPVTIYLLRKASALEIASLDRASKDFDDYEIVTE